MGPAEAFAWEKKGWTHDIKRFVIKVKIKKKFKRRQTIWYGDSNPKEIDRGSKNADNGESRGGGIK